MVVDTGDREVAGAGEGEDGLAEAVTEEIKVGAVGAAGIILLGSQTEGKADLSGIERASTAARGRTADAYADRLLEEGEEAEDGGDDGGG